MAVGERVSAYDYEARPELSTVELGTKEKLAVIVRKNKLATAGAGILILALIGAFIIPLFYGVDPLATNSDATLQAPSAEHPFGTDTFGRDLLARIIYAARLDFLIAISVTSLALAIGTCIGAIAGYARGLLDDVVMRFVDLMLSFPAFILALAITVMLGNEIRYVIAAVAFAYIPHFVRLTRGEVLKIRDSEYVDAARVVGNPSWRVAFRHVFPNAVAPALVFASIVLGWAILDASALGFLGIGIKPPTPEWGTMVAEGSDEIFSGGWWTWLFPGLAILAVVLAFNWLGDGLRSLLRSA
jgi:peptide/nickel transport system permease protein